MGGHRSGARDRLPGRGLSTALERRLLVGLYAGAAVLHALAGRGHVTPFVFPDELAYIELARSFASLDPFHVRGEPYWFSAPLGPLLQAPAWLFESVATGYSAAKALNAAVMATAVFPIHWLAGRLRLSPGSSLLAAAAGVAAPGLALHTGMLSESVAYPAFFLALCAIVRAAVHPGRGPLLAAGALLSAAALTRVQFLALPAVYALCAAAVPLAARRPVRPALRAHLPVLLPFAALGALILAVPYLAKGDYYSDLPVPTPAYGPLDVLEWAGRTAALLPWGLGWLVLPAAVGGLVVLARSRRPADAAFATATIALVAVTYAEIGVVRAGDWHHPSLERYAIYLTPLVVLSALVYAERGAPLRRATAAVAAVLAVAAWLVAFPTGPPFDYAFDSTTRTAYAFFGQWLEARSARLADLFEPLASAGVTAGLAVVAVLGGRGQRVAVAATVAFLLATTAAYYRHDAAVTRGIARAWLPTPPSWLDRAGLEDVDYVELPHSLPPVGREAETWNRAVADVVYLRARPAGGDRFPSQRGRIGADGTLLVGGSPVPGSTLLLNTFGSRLEHDWETVASPHPALTLVRVPARARIRSLAAGVYFDRWTARDATFEVWPRRRSGSYRVLLALPAGHRARTVLLRAGSASRPVTIEPGTRRAVELTTRESPVPPLELTSSVVDLVDARRNPRRVGVRALALELLP